MGSKEFCLYGHLDVMIERGVWMQRRWRSSQCRTLSPSCESYEASFINKRPCEQGCTETGSLHYRMRPTAIAHRTCPEALVRA